MPHHHPERGPWDPDPEQAPLSRSDWAILAIGAILGPVLWTLAFVHAAAGR